MKPFFVTIPHSGERVPAEAHWLGGLREATLARDVDRFVDRLYAPVVERLGLECIVSPWHRYAIDLNRLPGDIDVESVVGAGHPAGTFTRGLHWVKTTRGEVVMTEPIPQALHDRLVDAYFAPFHEAIEKAYASFRARGAKNVFHHDLHSMPSLGTAAHADPGETRADIVVSDFKGRSCSPDFSEMVRGAFARAGLSVAHNWPYFGGRLTQYYGRPREGQHVAQVEISRALYMDEETKEFDESKARALSGKLGRAMTEVHAAVDDVA